MIKRWASYLALFVVAFSTVVAAPPAIAPAAAQQAQAHPDYRRAIELANGQRLLSQRLIKQLLLVALDIDKAQNIEEMRRDQETFDAVLRGLRDGDPQLKLAGTADPAILEKLGRVEEIWPLLSAVIRESLGNGEVAPGQLTTAADLNLPLLRTLDETVAAFEEASRSTGLFSVLRVAIDLSVRQQLLSQKMSKEFFFIARGHDVARSRRQLSETIDQFDAGLSALIEGDPQRSLLPAPTPRIKAQLRSVQRLWQIFQPLLESGLRSDQIPTETVRQIAEMNLVLEQEMGAAVDMFEAL